MSTRHDARMLALQVLYQVDFCQTDDSSDALVERHLIDFGGSIDEAGRAYANALCRGTLAQLAAIDGCIERAADNWRIDRMSVIDRNILRLAVHEISIEPKVPVAVVLDEAIELAKQFGSEQSAKFINGVLDKIAQSGTLTLTPQPLRRV